MLGSASHSQHTQHSHWGNSDGVAYIHTTPLLQGKPVSDPHFSGSMGQPQSPFQAPSVQSQPSHLTADHQLPCQQQQQQQQQQRLQSSGHVHAQHHLPMIMEQNSNQSISPSDTAQFSGSSPTASSCSSPSASTAANTSSSDLRAFADGSVEGPLMLPPMTPPYPMHGSTPFQGAQDSLDASSSQQGSGSDFKLGTGGLNKSRYRGVSYDKKKRKWRVQIKVSHALFLCIHAIHISEPGTCLHSSSAGQHQAALMAVHTCSCHSTVCCLQTLALVLQTPANFVMQHTVWCIA